MAEQDQVPKNSAPQKAADSGGSMEILPAWLDENIPTPAIKALIWINTAVFLAMVNSVLYSNAHIPAGSPTTRESILFFSSHTLFAWGANAAWRTILDKEYWRILTNTFIHASVFHLAINMYVLWSFSSMVERLYGRSRFLLIYFLSAIGSSVCSLLLLSADGISVGASGAIFGTFGALVAFFALHRKFFPKAFFRMHAKIFFLFAAYSIVSPMLFKDMDNAAHLGGFVVGLCAALCVLPARPGTHLWGTLDFIRAAGLTAAIIAGFICVTTLDSGNPKVAGEHAYAEAVRLLKNYDPLGAIPYLDRSLQSMPDNAAVYLDRAAAYGMLKMHEKSIADLNQALRIDPKNKKGYFERAARFHSLGEERKAIADIDQVLMLDKKAIVAYSNRAWYYDVLNEPDQAIADSSRAISMDQKSPWAYDTRGVAYCLKGMYNEAIADFDRYILLKSKRIKNGAIYYHRAFAYYKLGKTELAKQDLAAARASIYRLEPCEQQWFSSMLSEL